MASTQTSTAIPNRPPFPALTTVPVANQSGALPIGASFSVGVPLPIELDLPGMPKRFYEAGPIRFKFLLDGKYEAGVGVKGQMVNQTNELKIDAAKRSASLRSGLKGKFGALDTQVTGKLSPDSIKALIAASTNPKKFGLALLRYLDVVLGHNFNVGSDYMKFVGVGFALDLDGCFFSMLLPVRLPLAKLQNGPASASGTVVADMVIKIGPSKELVKEIAKRVGAPRAYAMFRLLVQKANIELPKAITTTEVASASAMLEAIGVWIGAFSMAVPIALAITDFMLYVTRSAREAGVKDGQMMVYATDYVRAIYGLENLSAAGGMWTPCKAAAIKAAAEHIEQYGQVTMQIYLERNFMNGTPCADQNGENPDRIQIRVMAERMWLRMSGR